MIHHCTQSLPGGTVVVLHNTSQTTTVDAPEWHSKINPFTDWDELALPHPGRCGCHSLLELFTTSPTGVTIPSHPGRCGHHSDLALYKLTHRWSHTFTSRPMWLPITPCTLLSHPQVSPCLYSQADEAATRTLHFTISPTGDPIPSHPGKCGCHSHLALHTSSPTDSPKPSHPGRCDDSTEYDWTLKKVILTALLQILPQVDVSASSSVSSTCLHLTSYCQCQIHLLMSVNSSVKFHHPGPVNPILQHQFQQTICIHLCQFCPPKSVSPSSVSSALQHQSCLWAGLA